MKDFMEWLNSLPPGVAIMVLVGILVVGLSTMLRWMFRFEAERGP